MVDAYSNTTLGLLKAGQFNTLSRLQAISLAATEHRFQVLGFTGDARVWLAGDEFAPARRSSVEITTHTGRRLRLAPGQRLAALDDELNFTAADPREMLVIPRLVAPVPDEQLDLLERLELPEERKKTHNRYHAIVDVDEDLGYLLGVIAGDGWVNGPGSAQPNAIMIANTDADLQADVYRIMRRYRVDDALSCSVTDNPHDFNGHACFSQKLQFSSCRLAQLVREEIGCGARNKHLPSWWARTSSAFRWGLLAGLIDTDGTVALCEPKAKKGNVRSSQVQVVYHTTSPALMDGTCALAYSLGLTPSVTPTQTPGGDPAYMVGFSQDSIAFMRGRLPLRIQAKAQTLAAMTRSTARRTRVYAPYLSVERRKELRRATWSVKAAKRQRWPKLYERRRFKLYGNISDTFRKADPKRGRRGSGALTLDTAQAIIREMPAFFAEGFWRRWRDLVQDPEIGWEVIVSVEEVSDGQLALPTMPGAFTVSGGGLLVTSSDDSCLARDMDLAKAA